MGRRLNQKLLGGKEGRTGCDQSVGFFFSSASGWQIGCVGVSRSTAAQLLAEEAPLVCGCCSVPAGLELAAVGKETEGVKAAGSLVMAAPLFWPLLLEAEWRGTVRGSEKQRKRRAVAAVLIAAGEPNGGDREVGRRSEVGCSFSSWRKDQEASGDCAFVVSGRRRWRRNECCLVGNGARSVDAVMCGLLLEGLIRVLVSWPVMVKMEERPRERGSKEGMVVPSFWFWRACGWFSRRSWWVCWVELEMVEKGGEGTSGAGEEQLGERKPKATEGDDLCW
uniref:Uncharacterized protein n=1 Tax=Populus alba TaxID=43335 RepID=A0A4U5PWY6_POPAL|nr:hypothetical protein D5086_0000166440 [Populus alba]